MIKMFGFGKKKKEESKWDKFDECILKHEDVHRSSLSDFASFAMMDSMANTMRQWEERINTYQKEISDLQGQLKSLTSENFTLKKELKKWTVKEKVEFT
jgi:hypothetical protein